jgi:DNA-binding Lrp family transcriptional regulator
MSAANLAHRDDGGGDRELSPLDRRLLDAYQRNFPLTARPYAAIAADLGHAAGWSTLAAIMAPADRLEAIAALVSGCPEVNHNYERDHDWNLWFVVTAASAADVARVLRDIAARTGLTVLDLPLLRSYRLDLGFPLQWD